MEHSKTAKKERGDFTSQLDGSYCYDCSACGGDFYDVDDDFEHCPRCGAEFESEI